MSRRRASIELAKTERRERLITAAGDLIRLNGSTDFSMQTLARHVNLSTNTTYNLIGSKAAVLYVLLNKSIDKIDAERILVSSNDDPISRLIAAGDAAVDVFTAEPSFYRPLLKYLFSAEESLQRAEFMRKSYLYWENALAPLAESVSLEATGLQVPDLTQDVLVFFTGATEFWVHDDFSSPEFRAQVRLGLSLRLLCVASDVQREILLEIIAVARPTLRTASHRAEGRSDQTRPISRAEC